VVRQFIQQETGKKYSNITKNARIVTTKDLFRDGIRHIDDARTFAVCASRGRNDECIGRGNESEWYVAQVSGKLLQPLQHKAWGLAAVAADPTYFNTFNQLSIGYQHYHEWNKGLEMVNKARAFLNLKRVGPCESDSHC
jgi:hypothetical protein